MYGNEFELLGVPRSIGALCKVGRSLGRLFAYFAWFAVSLRQDVTQRRPRAKRNTQRNAASPAPEPHRRGGTFAEKWSRSPTEGQ